MHKYAHRVAEISMGYKPRGKAGRFTVSHSWAQSGMPGRYCATTYHPTAKAAFAYASRLRAEVGE